MTSNYIILKAPSMSRKVKSSYSFEEQADSMLNALQCSADLTEQK